MRRESQGNKAQRDDLRRQLLELGYSYERIAREMAARWGFRPRTGWRHAYGWTQDELAARYNVAISSDQAPMTGKRISDYENWPPGGIKPTLQALAVLARVFGTQTSELVDLQDHQEFTANERIALESPPLYRDAPIVDSNVQTAIFRLPDSEETIPRQLPADVRGFVDRVNESSKLSKLLDPVNGELLPVSLVTIVGTAGVGKTSLALRWAHQVYQAFPSGQLYMNLRGYDPGAPVTPEQTLESFLRALGVQGAAIPMDLDSRAALYRSLLAERRMLIILDNAATTGQVRPLLPGTAGCLTLVTSRSSLSSLVAHDGAYRLRLDVLAEPDAIDLIRTATGAYRPEDDPGQLAELANLCARLPLALRIAAERAARRPTALLGELIDDLCDESALWDALSSGDADESEAVRTAFAWSYRALSPEAARAFRLLGLHPGADFSTAAAAALFGTSVNRARHLLEALTDVHLIEQATTGRCQFHDLLRLYATDQAVHEESNENRVEATQRLFTWYLHSVRAAAIEINFSEPLPAVDYQTADISPMEFTESASAMRWFEAERGILVAVVRSSAEAEMYAFSAQLALSLRAIYMMVNYFDDWFATTDIGLRSARRIGDRLAEVELLESLAIGYSQSHRLKEGVEHYHRTLDIRRELADKPGEALALNGLGILHLDRRDLEKSRASFEQGLSIFRELNDRYWEAVIMGNLSEVYVEQNRLPEALALVDSMIEVIRESRDPLREGNALHILSVIQRKSGNLKEARRCIERALAIARDHQNLVCEAYWLIEFGRVQQEIGQPADALVAFQRAATLHRKIGDKNREAQAMQATGDAYRHLERLGDSSNFYRYAVKFYRELGTPWELAIALDSLAFVLAEAGATIEAQAYWQEVLTLIANHDDPAAIKLHVSVSERLLGTM
ncbi:tetratricopeptide repeat protein [Amycolatopsis sp. H20-H5]|uniref:tetratricopeptide repeat protein n=1 Tax=Amycolatopsis sp. H20-H5 TaxID=3046309 RepID=UPI002DB782DE|nr:tetratricopeptide repeat protein [Amycolatopsis sp. H20-H5]MEC3974868.1 tetratricopeptide repeat protein [Amycolatopsis sp. H20-H5]